MELDLNLTSGQMAFVTPQVNLTAFAKNNQINFSLCLMSWSQFSWIAFSSKAGFITAALTIITFC